MQEQKLKEIGVNSIEETSDKDTNEKIKNAIGSSLDPDIAGALNRTLDNPEAMDKLKQQQEADQVTDNKSMLLVGLVSALGGLFGSEVAGPEGAAAGMGGALKGAQAMQDFAGSLKDQRLKEEEIDARRREKLGILTPAQRLQQARLLSQSQENVNKQQRFEKTYSQKNETLDLNRQREGRLTESQSFQQGKQVGDIKATWNTRLEKDNNFAAAMKSEGAADNILNLTASARAGTKLAGSALKRAAARAAGEVGVMTDQDVAAFGGKQSYLNRLNRFVQLGAVGNQMTSADLDEFEKLANAMKDAARKRKVEAENRLAPKFAAERGVTVGEVNKVIKPEQPQVPMLQGFDWAAEDARRAAKKKGAK